MHKGMRVMRKRNIEILRPGMHEYPASLSEINNSPKQLYYMGDISILKKRCAAVVGSRNTNQYGHSR